VLRRKARRASCMDLSLADREVDVDLLKNVREVFVHVVRAHYWEQVESGRLPRESDATLNLLTSTDIALDEVDIGICDWSHIEKDLEVSPTILRGMEWLDSALPERVKWDDYLNAWLIMKRREDAFYTVTSYILAHEHAQRKIATYFGEDDSEIPDTPEEIKVVGESKLLVEKAQQALAEMEPDLKTECILVQVAGMVLEEQQKYIRLLIEEGLLSPKEGSEFIDEVLHDIYTIHHKRTHQAKHFARKNVEGGAKLKVALKVAQATTAFEGLRKENKLLRKPMAARSGFGGGGGGGGGRGGGSIKLTRKVTSQITPSAESPAESLRPPPANQEREESVVQELTEDKASEHDRIVMDL